MIKEEQFQACGVIGAGEDAEDQRTLGEHIDHRIFLLTAEIDRLRTLKTGMAPILGIRLRDVRDVASWY